MTTKVTLLTFAGGFYGLPKSEDSLAVLYAEMCWSTTGHAGIMESPKACCAAAEFSQISARLQEQGLCRRVLHKEMYLSSRILAGQLSWSHSRACA